jgi:hypothetical protein
MVGYLSRAGKELIRGLESSSLANAPVTTCNHVYWLRLLVLKCIDPGLCI